MALVHQVFPSIFLSVSIFFIIINDSCSSNSNFPPFSFSCGNGLEIGYPFWQKQSHETVHYGYPSLGISCINKTPAIELGNHLYHVKSINNSEKTIILSYHEASDQVICPTVPHDVGIVSSFLSYSKDVKMLRMLYNCTVYPSGFEPIKCLQIGAKHSYVFLEGTVPKLDWKDYCESMVTIPAMEKNVNDSLITSFAKALNEGFELEWSPDPNCGSCEASGRFCEYDSATKQVFYCPDQVSGATNLKLGFLSIGLLICGLAIAGTTIYIVKKRRYEVHRRGFNPLPNTGK